MKAIAPILILFACLFLFKIGNAQNALIERFGEEAIASIQGTEKLAILEFQNIHGYEVQDLSGIKDISEYPDALEVTPTQESTPMLNESVVNQGFELFAYDFPNASGANLYYRVGNTGKLMVIYKLSTVKHLFDKNSAK